MRTAFSLTAAFRWIAVWLVAAVLSSSAVGRVRVDDDPADAPEHVPADPKTLTRVLRKLVELHNLEREKAEPDDDKEKAGPLEPDARLMAAALRHAEDMAKMGHTEHQGSDESTMIERTREAGYRFRFLGENVAAGQKTPELAMTGWLNSEGHRKNILNSDYTQIGVALVRSRKGVNYWCVVFGRPLVKPAETRKGTGKPRPGPGR